MADTIPNGRLSRRTLLKAAGAGVALSVGMSGVGSARPTTCPEGLTLLAKYNTGDPDGDGEEEFVFEKGRESLNVGAGSITFFNVVRKEGEVVSFEFDASPYYVNSITVKAGPNTYTKVIEGESGSFDVREFDDQGPVQAISNVLFCKDVFWQLDFGEGEPEQPPRYGDESPSDLILAALSDRQIDTFQNPSFGPDGSPNGDAIELLNDYFENLDDTKLTDEDATDAKIRFGKANESFAVHIAAWEMPGPFDRGDLDDQVLYDSDTTSAAGDLELEVSLPTS